MNDDRFAEQIKTALAARRPRAARELSERLEAAAQRPARPRLMGPAVLAGAVAIAVLFVITTRPGERAEPSEPSILSAAGEPTTGSPAGSAGARTPSPSPSPSPVPAPAGSPTRAASPTPTPLPTPSPAVAAMRVDVRDPLAGYQAVLEGTSSVSIAPAQAARLRALAAELASQRAYLVERKRDAEAELASALAATPPEDSRVLAAYDRIAAQQAALGRAQLVARLGARAVLDAGQRNTIEGTARRATPGRPRLTIRSSIAGSAYIDGTRVGDTPVTISVVPGKHEVRIDAPGCDLLTTYVDVGAGEISLDLDPHRRRAQPAAAIPAPPTPAPPAPPTPAPSSGDGPAHLTLTTRPSLTIYLDGKPIGQTPIDVTLATGRHELKMVGSDQRTRKTMTLNATPGQRSNLSFSFDD